MKDIVHNLFFLCIIFFISCGTSKGNEPSTVTSPPIASVKDDREITITVDNPTIYNVYIEGDIEKRIGKNSKNNKVTLLVEDGTLSGGFNICYEIPLSNTFSIYYKGDHRLFRENQTSFIVSEPRTIESSGTYIILNNKANNAVRLLVGKIPIVAWIQTGSPAMGDSIMRSDKREFNPGETVVFRMDNDSSLNNYSIQDGSKTFPLSLPKNIERNYCYTFEYSKDSIIFADARPLLRIGETAWAKIINNASGPMPLVAADGEINLFASIDKGLIRNVYDSAGNIKESVRNGDSFYILYASKAENGFFVAGYEKLRNGSFQPVVRIHNMDGSTRYVLKQSEIYKTARFFTAAQKDNTTWLLAGDGEKIGTNGNTAYARMVQVRNDELITVWELSPDIKCGDIQAAVYDNTRDCWFVTGENIDNGSYIAQIDNNGKIDINDSFKDMSFYKILIDKNGIFYLAGEERQGNETHAIFGKYTINDSRFQRITTQAASHSYYNDALLDTANNRIILGGVMKAEDEKGIRGIPFVDVVDVQTGTRMEHEELSNLDIKETGAVLVTAIATAPDYGFVLTLSGMGNEFYDEPYMIVRVNSQGKYIKEI